MGAVWYFGGLALGISQHGVPSGTLGIHLFNLTELRIRGSVRTLASSGSAEFCCNNSRIKCHPVYQAAL